MNKNIINRRRLSLSRISNQYPWNLAKLRRSLKNRKWFRRKFSPDIAPGKVYFKKKKMKTYETRVKMLFRRLYAPGVNATQFKKLFKFKNRYRSTFRTIASLEHQFDTLVFRLYLLKNITLAQYCISNNFFLLNGESKLCWKSVVHPGNFIEVNSAKIWNIFYIHILSSMASLKKYYNRLFFKVCYPFVGKKKISDF
jgi:ribosomal protein S4